MATTMLGGDARPRRQPTATATSAQAVGNPSGEVVVTAEKREENVQRCR